MIEATKKTGAKVQIAENKFERALIAAGRTVNDNLERAIAEAESMIEEMRRIQQRNQPETAYYITTTLTSSLGAIAAKIAEMNAASQICETLNKLN